ncbi:MAG TPA: hypothetical protein VKM55_08890 [Candidatus Lokiarchaeia archaeon]|nr:hypothetical protein [Candidatus Lokiarchaeia archaeon]
MIEQLEKLLDDESLIDFRFIMKARVEAYYYLELIIGSKNFTECLGCSERIMAEIERGSKDLYDVGDELNYFREAQDAKNGSTKRPRRKQK